MNSYLAYMVLCFTTLLVGGWNSRDTILPDGTIPRYVPLSCGLYRDQAGEIYFKSTEMDMVGDSVVYRDIYIGYVWSDSFMPEPTRRLRDVVDTATFRSIDGVHYTDTNHVYYHFAQSDGGVISVVDAAHKPTFRVLTGYYAVDSFHVYHRGRILKEADPQTFTAPIFGTREWYGRDKNHYFDGDAILSEGEVKQLTDEFDSSQ